MKQFLGFEPLLFLEITNLKDEEKNIVSRKLLDRIAFQQVVGKTTQEYYLSFEALRQQGFK